MATGRITRSQAIYREWLKHPEWIKKRLHILERDNYRCTNCKRSLLDGGLDVHHISYLPGKMPWEHPDDLLVTLCRTCHDLEHMMDSSGGGS